MFTTKALRVGAYSGGGSVLERRRLFEEIR